MGATGGLTLAAAGTGAIGAAVVVLTARQRSTATSSVIARAVIAVALMGLVAGVLVVARLPLAAFALMHLAYLLMVIALPLVAVGFAAAWARHRDRRPLAVLAALLLVPIPLGIYATHIAPFRLREDHASLALAGPRAPEHRLRIGVLSDLQNVGITHHERSAVDRLMAAKPDLIFLAGDFFQGSPRQFDASLRSYRSMLRRLHAPGGVFAVRGDVDDGDEVDRLTAGTGIRVLDDEVTRTRVAGRTVVLGGTMLDYETAGARRVYRELEATRSADEIVILLSHRPDTVLQLHHRSRVDLVVAGHTHGGQIALPGIGPLLTLTSVPRHAAAGGLSTIHGNPTYISSGVGLERGQAPQVRFLTRPSFGIVDLT